MSGTVDKFPSGSWGIGPLNIQWSLKASNEVDVTVSVLGIQIDTLTGTLNQKNFKISNDISLLGLVTGTIGLEAKYGQASGNGLYITGQLDGIGIHTGPLNHCIIPW